MDILYITVIIIFIFVLFKKSNKVARLEVEVLFVKYINKELDKKCKERNNEIIRLRRANIELEETLINNLGEEFYG